jgi:hypothetical protein
MFLMIGNDHSDGSHVDDVQGDACQSLESFLQPKIESPHAFT